MFTIFGTLCVGKLIILSDIFNSIECVNFKILRADYHNVNSNALKNLYHCKHY